MKKVLIVDDAIFMRNVIKNILLNHGFDVVGEASNGLEAVQKYEELKPDIVTMDITMPIMSGIEALQYILANDPDAKIVMITALWQECYVKEAIMNGAKSFILKPFEVDRVVQTLNNILLQ